MELERLFHELVKAIRTADPSRLHQPHRLKDIQFGLVPYRSVRHPLDLECSEDHEMLLLRMCAGEGDYLRVMDADAERAFGEEAEGINPDLGLLEVYGDIDVVLQEQAINRSTKEFEAEAAYRPPDIAPASESEEERSHDEVEEPREPAEAKVIPIQAEPPAPAVPAPPPIPEPTQLQYPDPVSHADPEPEPEPDPEPVPYSAATPPGGSPAPAFELSPEDEEAPEAPSSDSGCAYCGGALPSTRAVNFCPHCGQNLAVIRCAECGTELEYGWRHCITCGNPVRED